MTSVFLLLRPAWCRAGRGLRPGRAACGLRPHAAFIGDRARPPL